MRRSTGRSGILLAVLLQGWRVNCTIFLSTQHDHQHLVPLPFSLCFCNLPPPSQFVFGGFRLQAVDQGGCGCGCNDGFEERSSANISGWRTGGRMVECGVRGVYMTTTTRFTSLLMSFRLKSRKCDCAWSSFACRGLGGRSKMPFTQSCSSFPSGSSHR